MKILIITDERCGGTILTISLKHLFNLKIIHDPQTKLKRGDEMLKEYDRNNGKGPKLLDYCYNLLGVDVLKVCFVSYTFEEYIELIKYCIDNSITVNFLNIGQANNLTFDYFLKFWLI